MKITREYIAEKQAARKALEQEALSKGQLWTVQIAYKPDEAIILIRHGYLPEDERDGKLFQTAHGDAGMFLDPTVVLGDKLHVRQQACKLANADVTRMVVIGAPKREPISPSIYKL